MTIVKFKKYFSPYKGEANIDTPPNITAFTAIIIGTIISFLFFVTDFIIGLVVQVGSPTDVQAIYVSAQNGDFIPLIISLLFSIIAGFIVVGISSRAGKVKEITKNLGIDGIGDFSKLVKKPKNVTSVSDTIGLQPGALVHVGVKKVEKITLSLIEYDKDSHKEQFDISIDECFSRNKTKTSWINVTGIHDSSIIEKIGTEFNLHPLIQSDIMNTELRPKIEINKDHIFLILKIPHFDSAGKLLLEQFSMIFGKNFILSFQETEDDLFIPIKNRIKESIGEVSNTSSDYLAYALCDTIIDNFFTIMEKIGAVTEQLEEELMSNPTPQTLNLIHTLKRQMVLLRKTIWPMREVIDSFERADTELISTKTKRYIRDVYSHTVQVMDTVEGLRDMVGGLLDTYLSSVSNRMNEVMKTLTIIASIFIPITFIAGIYGTNFSYVPELAWEGSYFVMLGVMSIIVIMMLAWFRKKQWV